MLPKQEGVQLRPRVTDLTPASQRVREPVPTVTTRGDWMLSTLSKELPQERRAKGPAPFLIPSLAVRNRARPGKKQSKKGRCRVSLPEAQSSIPSAAATSN